MPISPADFIFVQRAASGDWCVFGRRGDDCQIIYTGAFQARAEAVAEAVREMLVHYGEWILAYDEQPMPTTHYLATAENSGTMASILPADLVGAMFDDGMAQNGTINRARTPEGQYCRPPDLQAFQALADIAAGRTIPITIEAEGLLRYAYDLWLSNNTECRAVMADVATGLGYMKTVQPTVPLWIEHQGQLTQSISLPRPSYAAFMAHEASLMSSKITGCTIMVYFSSLDFSAWTADADFYRTTMATYYPGKRIKLIASSYLYAGPQTEYVGDAAMQHVVNYAAQHDCDILWWSASVTAPMHAQAFSFLRGLLLAQSVRRLRRIVPQRFEVDGRAKLIRDGLANNKASS